MNSISKSYKKKSEYLLGILRISLGFIFLWAFFDKLLGLGFATEFGKAWINGISPTYGFLKFATTGPFAGFFQALAGNILVDILFMAGLFFIGLALILGITTKLAGYSGTLLLFLMWLSVLPPKNNPILDEHLIYILVLILLVLTNSGEYIGFGKKWTEMSLVRRFKLLK